MQKRLIGFSAEPPLAGPRGYLKRVSVLPDAYFILSIALTDFLFAFEIQYYSLLLTHEPGHKAKLVPKAFLFLLKRGRAAEKPWRRGWYKARKDHFRTMIPNYSFEKIHKMLRNTLTHRKVKLQKTLNSANLFNLGCAKP